jgi:hypothetical protein
MNRIVKSAQVAALGMALLADAGSVSAAAITEQLSAPRQESGSVQFVAGRSQGFFSRVMEMERRKNAWLRGLFR